MAFFARENIAVPDDKKNQILYKWPDVLIRRFTKAIVAPDEVAVFLYQGQVIATLPPGQHTVDAKEIPGLGTIKDILTGGNAYRTELYFAETREFTDQRFGGRIDEVQDPQTGLVIALRVFGDYSMQVIDAPALITRLTGTLNVEDNNAITNWMTEQLLKVMRSDITTNVLSNGWAILGLSAHTAEIEQSVLGLANEQLKSYGIAIARMGNFTISLNDDDEQTLKNLAKDTAYSRLAGSFGQYAAGELQIGAGQGMAQGGSGTGGAFFGAGLGLGGQAAQPAAPGTTPPPAPGFAGGGSGYGAQTPATAGSTPATATVVCPECKASNPAGAHFCASCGKPLAPPVTRCAKCNVELAPGAKFCPQCGTPTTPNTASNSATTQSENQSDNNDTQLNSAANSNPGGGN